MSDPIFSGDNDWIFWLPSKPHPSSAWLGHIPFAHWLVGAIRPRTIVELGTFVGSSYGAFCQSVQKNGLETRCWAVDTWQGDVHTGHYGDNVFQNVKAWNDENCAGFSTLLRMTFDEAALQFEDGSVDLLHIDGLHTYEAVRHDFETWLPKLSPSGVVLFHDAVVRSGDFGVWRLWEEVTVTRPHFLFTHTHGLGVLEVGPARNPRLMPLFDIGDERRREIDDRFAMLGASFNTQAELWKARRQLEQKK